MITAQEARIKTQEQIDNDIYVGIDVVEEYINKAILDGKFGIDCAGTLSLETRKQLMSLGYEVHNEFCHNWPSYKVTL